MHSGNPIPDEHMIRKMGILMTVWRECAGMTPTPGICGVGPVVPGGAYNLPHHTCDLQKNVNSTRGTECPLLVYTFSSLVPVPWVSRLLLSLMSPHVPLFATAWTVAAQAPLSMRFPRQDYWGG